MKTIHSTKIGNRQFYKAADVFKAIGSRWHGYEQLEGIPGTHYKMVKGAFTNKKGVVTTGSFIGLTDKGVAAICKQKKVKNPLEKVAPVEIAESAQISTNRDVEKLQAEVAGLKALLACSLTVNKSLLTPKKDDTLIEDLSEREAIRHHVTNFVTAKATELGVSDKADLGKLFDLAYTKLYKFFQTIHGTDLKQIAEDNGTTALQAAEDEGILDLLLSVTEKLYA